MGEHYFAKPEEIDKGEKLMVILDIKVDNLYAFKNFHMNMSYPKKIVGSTIPEECLEGRPNFRYRKVNIIMGGNATGKTSLGKLLMWFFNSLEDGMYSRFFRYIDDRSRDAALKIDFVTAPGSFCRLSMVITATENGNCNEENIKVDIWATDINKKDNYETCAKKMERGDCRRISPREIYIGGWQFYYPQDARQNIDYRLGTDDDARYLIILEKVLKTLDPSVRRIVRIEEADHTYAIKLGGRTIMVKEGRMTDADAELLSSGTKAGLDISAALAALICGSRELIYCDELFSYVNSDVEKACLSIMIDSLTGTKQLFFTTHNTDILDMQLPKHSFIFLKKDVEDEDMPIKCVNAAEYLKRNTDSLKHAVENDLFCTAPAVDKLYEIAEF